MYQLQLEKFWVHLVCMLIAFWPIEYWYLRRLFDGGDEPLGLVILLLTIWIFQKTSTKIDYQYKWLLGSCVLLIFYIFSYSYLYNLFRAGLALSIAYCCFRSHYRSRLNILPSLGLLYLSLPVIASLQFYGGYIFRRLTSLLCELQFLLLGQKIVSDGVNLSFQNQIFVVDAPCSGLKGLWFLCIFITSISCFNQSSNRAYCKVLVLTLIVAIWANSVRSVSLIYLEFSSYANDFTHSAIGIVTFIFSCLVLLIFLKFEGGNKNA